MSELLPEAVKKIMKGDRRLRILILTGNEHKKKEYEETFKPYGLNIFYSEDEEASENPENKLAIANLLVHHDPSPHFIIRETSKLENALTGEEVCGKVVINDPKSSPPLLLNVAKVDVWIPFWDSETQKLQDLEHKVYKHSLRGFIDPNRIKSAKPDSFGWDHIFVNPQTGQSLQESSSEIYGKTSARQLVIADFLTNHLFYKKPQSLKFHAKLLPKQGIEFSDDMSVANFISSNRYLSNPNLNIWGLEDIHTRILNEGVFFKAATCRPIKNYFSPPFAGIPLTPKKSEAEETIFMYHDLNHHNIPDLICDFSLPDTNNPETALALRNVYVVWRMMSEAMTIIIADMLYADTLVKTDSSLRSVVDQRIYPLFEAVNLVGSTKEKIMSLLYANTYYAILGDDSEWKKLLKVGQEDKLDAYKNHFEKFFIGDHIWTHKNYLNMESMKENLRTWVDLVGRDTFRDADVPLLSDVVRELSYSGANLSTIHSTVPVVFQYIIENRIFPKDKLNTQPIIALSEEIRREKAWKRYLIGQMSFYSHFMEVDDILNRGKIISQMLHSNTNPEDIYSKYCSDVKYLWASGIITGATAHNYLQVHPIFPPIFITYGRLSVKKITDILVQLYNEEANQEKIDINGIQNYMKNRVLFLIGYPGSGKGTQGKLLSEELNICHLSTGELFRAEAKTGSEVGKKMDEYMQKGQIIPQDLTFSYLKNELSKEKYRKGFLLDGYPKDDECRKFIIKTLQELQFDATAALYFDVSRISVTERLCGRLFCEKCEHNFHKIFFPPKEEGICDNCKNTLMCRRDDRPEAIEKRLDVFEQRTSDVLNYFKDSGLLVQVQGWKSPNSVYNDICRLLSAKRNQLLTKRGSYFSRPPFEGKPRSSVFHNHIDAKSHTLLREIIEKIDLKSKTFQNKIYPISSLQLGPQCFNPEFSEIYAKLPNFHRISDALEEAFSTGGMGTETFDYNQILATLETVSEYPDNNGIMTELEEDIFELEFDYDGNQKILLDNGETPYKIDWDKLPSWKEKMIDNVPKFELHHGIDIPKLDIEIGQRGDGPIDLSELHERTSEHFSVGGWFLFRKEDRWAYRSNEFSNQSYDECKKRLLLQAKKLREIIESLIPNCKFTSTCSLEKVHAIWSFADGKKSEQEKQPYASYIEKLNDSNTSKWTNMDPVGYDNVQEIPVSFLVKETRNPEILEQLNQRLTSTWINKLDKSKVEHLQRTPEVTVDTITVKMDKDKKLNVLLGIVDKEIMIPGNEKPVRCRGLVFPGGGHYERIGGRNEGTRDLYEPSHGSSIQAADKESLEEVGITSNSAIFRDCIAVMDVPEYCLGKQCVRIIFGMLINPDEKIGVSDEITTTFWVPLEKVKNVASKQDSFEVNGEKLHMEFYHDQMFLALQNCKKFKQFVKQCKEEFSS